MRLEERIAQKLEECRPYHERLVELRSAVAKPQADWIVWSAVERNLQLAIECAIDLGEMVIAWKRLPRPEEYREVFLLLGREGLVEEDLAGRLSKAAGLRNLLVHQYGSIDRERLANALQQGLSDFEAFARQVARLLDLPR